MTRVRIIGALLLAAFVMGSSAETVHAQTSSRALTDGDVDLHLYRPAVDSKGHFAVNGTDIIGHNHFSFGLLLDAGLGLMPYRGFREDEATLVDDVSRTSHIVDQAFTGRLAFNYGLYNWAIIGVQIPFVLTNGRAVHGLNNDGSSFYNPPNNAGDAVGGLSHEGIGDIVIHTKIRFLRVERMPVGLALVVRGEIPTANDGRFGGEPGFTLHPELVLEGRPHDRVRLSLQVGYRAIFGDGASFTTGAYTCPFGTTTRTDGECDISMASGANATGAAVATDGNAITYDDLLTFGLGGSFRIGRTVDYVLEGYGAQIADSFGDTGTFNFEVLTGFKIFVQEHSYLMIGGGAGVPRNGFQNADWRITAGIVFEPSIGDRDGDGLRDDEDECPDDPEDFDDFEDEDGCPDPDNDRDGILDVDDECPIIPEDRDGEEDEDGCPEGGVGDRDGDGIMDDVDSCPDNPEDLDGFEDGDGCPDPDNDEDGIPDRSDLCPDDPEDIDAWEDIDGCPDPDNDDDRILDVDDECPDVPETYNGLDDEDGCEDDGAVVIEDNQLIILDKIYFETDSAVIQRRSYPIIDAIAATLVGNPQISLIEVQGHADERGRDSYNLRLTRDRAASVVQALVDRGVDRSRLRSAGYGELCPVNPAHNRAAWEENRRVEFKIIETDGAPTGVQVACEAAEHLIPE